MKRGFFAAVLCGLTLFVCVVQAEIEGGYTYSIKGNGTVSITDFDWEKHEGDIYIPDMLGGYRVTAISEEAFSKNSMKYNGEAVVVTLPSSIKTIGEKAFMKARVASINIPASVQQIGGGAFAGCPMMEFVLEPGNTVYATIDGALYNKTTKTLVAWPNKKDEGSIPNGIVEVGDYALYGISGRWLEIDAFIPNSVEKIGDYAFANDDDGWRCMRAGSIGENVEIIGKNAFYNGRIESNTGTNAFTGRSEEDIVIGNENTIIDDEAFKCAQFPESGIIIKAQRIGDNAFAEASVGYSGCDMILDDCVREIGNSTFSSAENLIIGKDSNIEKVGAYAFEKVNLTYNDGDVFVTPKKLKNIENYAFSEAFGYLRKDWRTCKKIEVSEGTERIGDYAFERNEFIESVSLPSTLTEIGEGAFQERPALTSISIPSSVKKIGDGAFDRATITLEVEQDSYAALWASENGYKYRYQGVTEDTNWLNP